MSKCTSVYGVAICQGDAGHEGRHRMEGSGFQYLWDGCARTLLVGGQELRCERAGGHPGPHRTAAGHSWFPFDRDPERTAA
jgi:hypothetical protein